MGEALRLYNTLTRTKEDFRPIDPDNVRMYVCGPTVYDFAHIGNARPVIVFDVLYRLLRHLYGDDHVTYVRNITDVDDKINARAKRDYPDLPLNDAIRAVTEKTADQFHKDIAALGVLPPTVEPRATDHIDGMVAMIQTLLDKDNAYVAQGRDGREVLFDVHSMPDYGKLSKRNLDDQQAGARIAVEAHKKNPADFVLWKESDPNEPGWDGVFAYLGEDVAIHGRPGWHIECSVMSDKHLWEDIQDRLSVEAQKKPHQFDIHGGGLDLIFPHHENEIAQSCSAHGNHVMANVWMHNGFVQVEGRKMSKSEGNFVTIHELLETEKFGGRKWPGEVLRLAMLMTHYREPIDFSVKRLEEAENRLRKWRKKQSSAISFDPNYPELPVAFKNALMNDLDINAALMVIDQLCAEQTAEGTGLKIAQCLYFLKIADPLDDLSTAVEKLGHAEEFKYRYYFANQCKTLEELETFNAIWSRVNVNNSIEIRNKYLSDKNWAEADRIRDELAAQGIQLKDSKDKETGERITTWEVKR
ncbi:cysteine--tRNA ligase [Martelella soudanensis]|uniref:cysteine--tRNA ligase n=1 Tax=unclassified Martelella TaxID=2629616 RepID=UPI0015DF0116|nr:MULTISPECIES: cysteine--tRNA ligase [unclassified Martelella]